jgi:hypothetical protein
MPQNYREGSPVGARTPRYRTLPSISWAPPATWRVRSAQSRLCAGACTSSSGSTESSVLMICMASSVEVVQHLRLVEISNAAQQSTLFLRDLVGAPEAELPISHMPRGPTWQWPPLSCPLCTIADQRASEAWHAMHLREHPRPLALRSRENHTDQPTGGLSGGARPFRRPLPVRSRVKPRPRQPRGRQPSPLRRQPPYAPKLRSPAPTTGQGVGLKFGLSPPAAGAAARFGVRRAPRGINTIWNVARAPCGGWRRRLGLAGARNERHRRHPRLAFSSRRERWRIDGNNLPLGRKIKGQPFGGKICVNSAARRRRA